MIVKFRSIPTEIEAVEWTGQNLEELRVWTGDRFQSPPLSDRTQVYNELEGDWIRVPTFPYWIAKGTHGEFYPISPEVMDRKYERVDVDGGGTEPLDGV